MKATVSDYDRNHMTRRTTGPASFETTEVQAVHQAGTRAYKGIAVCGATPELGEFVLLAPNLAACDRIWEVLMEKDRSVVRIDKKMAQRVLLMSQDQLLHTPSVDDVQKTDTQG